MAKDWRPWKRCFKPASPRLLRRSCLCVHLHRWNRHLQDQRHPGLAYCRVGVMSVRKHRVFCQVWLYVVKEFGLVFAVHQTFLLDHQFCMVESKLLSYSAVKFSNSYKTPIPCSCLRPGLHFPVWLVVGPRELDQLTHPKLIISTLKYHFHHIYTSIKNNLWLDRENSGPCDEQDLQTA